MPIRLRNNPYRGVNAHLQSYLQTAPGQWQAFHASHIQHLRDAIDTQLPPAYIAESEVSLQVNKVSVSGLSLSPSGLVRPDITLSRTYPERIVSGKGYSPTEGYTIELPVEETFVADDVEDLPNAIVIALADDFGYRRPVTRIELLSPSNKRGGSGYESYLMKREETLLAGLRLVEIDFLHHLQPLFSSLPSYKERSDLAYPYAIAVTDPHPDIASGRMYYYGFGVDQVFPPINIPLASDDVLLFNFAEPYHYTYRVHRSYTSWLDYGELPLAFDTYSPTDQQRIRARMEAIRTESD